MTVDYVICILPEYVKLSGSRADGTHTDSSDWDFYVPERKWDEFRRWCLDNLGMFESNITGHIFYYCGDRTHANLIEFSYMFPNKRKLLATPSNKKEDV